MIRTLVRAFGLLLLCGAGLVGAARADDAGDINRLFATGHADEAFARLDKLLADKPHDPQWRFLKGTLLAQAQRRAEAAAIFEQLSIDYPDMPEPYNNLAVIQAAQGEYDKARLSLEAALRAQPGYAVAHQNLGDIYVQLARRSYAKALELDPANTALTPKLALLRQLVQPVAGAASAAASK
ncbi:MAG TPA: tetratricopeptide repeat protein [Albitalea sp.]|nr:tetratricopeptide repeat protein [Albitalea sp.]